MASGKFVARFQLVRRHRGVTPQNRPELEHHLGSTSDKRRLPIYSTAGRASNSPLRWVGRASSTGLVRCPRLQRMAQARAACVEPPWQKADRAWWLRLAPRLVPVGPLPSMEPLYWVCGERGLHRYLGVAPIFWPVFSWRRCRLSIVLL